MEDSILIVYLLCTLGNVHASTHMIYTCIYKQYIIIVD